MKGWIFTLLLFALGAFGIWRITDLPASSQGVAAAGILSAEPTRVKPTRTPGTPQPDLNATAAQAELVALHANQTASAADLQAAMLTAEEKDRLQVQGGWTAEAYRAHEQHLAETATAQPTSLALTATARMDAKTQVALAITQIAVTAQAPTQLVAMANAEASARTATWRAWAEVWLVFTGGLALLLLALLAFLALRHGTPAGQPAGEGNAGELVVTLKREEPGGYVTAWHTTLRCTPEMLKEFADGLAAGRRLSFAEWEKAGTSWQRPALVELREFLMANRLAKSTGHGELVLTDDGEAFFEFVRDQGAPPPPFRMDPYLAPSRQETAQARENHARGSGGEVVG